MPTKPSPAVPTTGGVVYRVPMIPVQEPRPGEGDQPDQKFDVHRRGREAEPTAKFVGAVKANDAAVEVIVGQGRLLTLKEDIATREGTAVVAVGDPTIVEFQVLPDPRMIRLIGLRAGSTDLLIATASGDSYAFEVHTVYDLELLRAQLRQTFPDASLELTQMREHLVVEGQARTPQQVAQILETIQGFLDSMQVSRESAGRGIEGSEPDRMALPGRRPAGAPAETVPPVLDDAPVAPLPGDMLRSEEELPSAYAGPEMRGEVNSEVKFPKARIINLIRVPGVNQVLLQVRVAELNRTALREIGADLLIGDADSGNVFGTSISGALASGAATAGLGGLLGSAIAESGSSTTAFGIFPSSDVAIFLSALRRNSLLSILAEPNLIAMNGQTASFLAGGEFPIPVPQGLDQVTIEYKEFGVQLNFIPYVLDDGVIRMTVSPEVSSIDETISATIVPGGKPVPGIATRRATTTVEMRQGQSLAIAGLLQVEIAGNTRRIPGLGDLPYIGPMFSNTSHRKVEKELLVLVTPYLVSPVQCADVPPLPGTEILEPNDLEFYLLGRIEGRTGHPHRSTTNWDDPMHLVEKMKLESKCISGPVGFSN